jgi:hypothetical protein
MENSSDEEFSRAASAALSQADIRYKLLIKKIDAVKVCMVTVSIIKKNKGTIKYGHDEFR